MNSIEAPLILNDEKAEGAVANMVCDFGNTSLELWFSVVRSGWCNFSNLGNMFMVLLSLSHSMHTVKLLLASYFNT